MNTQITRTIRTYYLFSFLRNSMLLSGVLVPLNPFIGFFADQSVQVALILVGILPLLVFFFSPIEQNMFED